MFIHCEHESHVRVQKELRKLSVDLTQFEQEFGHIKEFKQRLEILEKSWTEKDAHSRSNAHQKSALTSHVTKQVMKNSKGYLQQIILNAIVKQHSLRGTTLKNTMVDEQKITSKASLYRILSELEKTGKIKVIREGKEKTYSATFLEVRQ